MTPAGCLQVSAKDLTTRVTYAVLMSILLSLRQRVNTPEFLAGLPDSTIRKTELLRVLNSMLVNIEDLPKRTCSKSGPRPQSNVILGTTTL